MTEMPDREFIAYLEELEQGRALPASLPPEDAADLDLAKRLLALQAEPSPQLLKQVQQAVSTSPRRPSLSSRLRTWTRRIPTSKPRMPVWKRVALSLATLVLVFSVAMVAFPSARAAVLEVIRRIGGIQVIETDQWPQTPEERRGSWMTLVDTLPGDPPPEIIPEQKITLGEAEALLPFTPTLPTWVPEGYVLQDTVRVWLPTEGFTYTIAMWTWEKPGHPVIDMSILHSLEADYAYSVVVGQDSVEEVSIAGRPAALVRGGWDRDTKRYGTQYGILRLQWERDGLVLTLSGTEDATSADDLVRMAESIP